MRGIALAIGVCVLGVALGIGAQATTPPAGSMTGTVRESKGAALVGARVSLVREGIIVSTRLSDALGAFAFVRVPANHYDLTVALSGFSSFRTAIDVQAGHASTVDVIMTPASATSPPSPSASSPAPIQADALLQSARGDATALSPGGIAGGVPGGILLPGPQWNTEGYDRFDDSPFRRVTMDPLSTFSIDVDTASYANVRRFLNAGQLPPPDAVRVEELINYFRFDYPAPAKNAPVSITTELAACPWNLKHRLALVGLRAQPLELESLPARNLVFLIDVSGSMNSPDKLPLVRTGLRMLVDTLTPRDRIAIVVYAGASGVALPATSGAQKDTIHAAIARLQPGGSTNGAEGITLAYQIASQNFVKGGINRVILTTDGDFNVGVTSQGDLTRLIEEKRDTGVFLSVLGVGTGNVKDSTMEKLADRGNGNYSYLDTLHEARKVLINEGGATLVTVAKDVKIQIEFNPAQVAGYRLVGYENRILANQDFNNDRKDAGEMGAGHTVTALYELIPTGEEVPGATVDPLKYQKPLTHAPLPGNEVLTVKVRYKAPDGITSRLISVPMNNQLSNNSPNIGFAAAVAEWGMLLRHSEHAGSASHADAAALARRFRGPDPEGYRAEFIKLVELADSLKAMARR